MSRTVLYIVPENLTHIPGKNEREITLDLCKKIDFPFTNYDIYEEVLEKPSLFDCGEGFEKILCPNCSAEIDIEYWKNIMDKSFSNDYKNIDMKMLCCNFETSLNEIIYFPPMRIAQYAIVFNDIQYYPEKIILADIENNLKCKLIMIWAHY